MPETEPRHITFISLLLFSYEIMEQMKPELLWQVGVSLPSCPPPTSRLSLEAHSVPSRTSGSSLPSVLPAPCHCPRPPLTCCAQTAGSLGQRQGPGAPLRCDLGRGEKALSSSSSLCFLWVPPLHLCLQGGERGCGGKAVFLSCRGLSISFRHICPR